MHGAALWGFIGTLAGAIIGALAALGAQWMFQSREDKRAESQRQRDAVGALRTIELDLARAAAIVEDAIAAQAWWADSEALSSALWRENAGIAGVALLRNDWAVVAWAFHLFDRLELKRPRAAHAKMDTEAMDQARDALSEAEDAHELLKDFDHP